MGTFLAFLVAVAKLFYAQPWSKIAIFGLAVFVGGCVMGVKLTRGVVKAVTPDRKADDVDRFPRIKILRADEPEAVEAKPEPMLPEAAEAVLVPEPKASATVCVGGSCSSGSRVKVQARPQRRFFGRWR